jgi:hypothetical protein
VKFLKLTFYKRIISIPVNVLALKLEITVLQVFISSPQNICMFCIFSLFQSFLILDGRKDFKNSNLNLCATILPESNLLYFSKATMIVIAVHTPMTINLPSISNTSS